MKTILRRFVPCLMLVLGTLVSPVEAAVTLVENRTLPADDLSLEGEAVVVDGAVLTVSGTHRFRSLSLENGAVLNHPAAPTGEPAHAVRLILTETLVVDATSRIDVTGAGYAVATAPGSGQRGNHAGGGGGHGGNGSASAGGPAGAGGSAFGSILAPESWGGPGGNGSNSQPCPGGGLISVEAGGDVTVEGAVRANGANATIDNQGGGAGGTILIRCGVLRGAGTLTADGGAGEWVDGGGGAGGRIALFHAGNDFAGTVSAAGGGGAGRGGAGTVYLKPAGSAGQVVLRNASRGAWTPVDAPAPYHLVLRSDAVAYPTAPLDLTSLTLEPNSVLMQAPGSTGLVARVTGDVRIDAGSVLTANGRGYPLGDDRGPGAGVPGGWAGAGGSHAGLGGTSRSGAVGGDAYGSFLQPVTLGSQGGDSSSGPGLAGGGLIRLTVGGTLTLLGRCSADGLSSTIDNSGGGSGGSVWLDAGAFAGDGWISANGGAGEWVEGGGGGGGRVALYTRGAGFGGRVTAEGGGGSQKGGAGTVYLRGANEAEGFLAIDNGGAWGAQTPVESPEAVRLLLTNNAACYAEAPLRLNQLVVAPNAVLTHLTGRTNLEIHVTGDLTIASGGRVVADGKGYPIFEDRGLGMGVRKDHSGSGGGHGGMGGHAVTGVDGGGHYGSLATPKSLGSQGGDGSGGAGAAGGGAIRLVVGSRLTVDGRLSADGLNAGPDNAGGGSGGSVWLTLGTLAGAGTISVNGGAGEWVEGGGGGGGRIALYYLEDTFNGAVSAWGGGGRERGGAGTIYRRPAGTTVAQVLVHNGDVWGNYTPLEAPSPLQLTLAGKAYAYPVDALTLQDLEIRTNATLTHLTGQTNLSFHVLGSASIHEGGSLNVDGRGYPPDDATAPGAGQRAGCCGSGGGHGGIGATGVGGAAAGPHNDSILEPILRGSPGGPGSGGPGLPGGGAVRLVVDGALLINGRLSANGLSSTTDNSGGGSGGSLWLTAGSLSGFGTISANGGAGEWVEGGGGGGGRIALIAGGGEFTGDLTAYGGGGSQRGGAGTIYQRRKAEALGRLLVHNGDQGGTYTPLSTPEAFDLTLAGRAYVYPLAPLTVRNLEVLTNSTLTHLIGQARCDLIVQNNLTLAEGGVISADGRGYPVDGAPGPGTGARLGSIGGGGGHGGRGATGVNGADGGPSYGSYTDPDTAGSQGGSGSGGVGGAGGGVIRIAVGNVFLLDGRLSAIGLNAPVDNAGGGSGGSLHVTANSLQGSGLMTVDGGAGEWVDGGGGAGGRIALHLQRDGFLGRRLARGGGNRFGGSGTIYTRVGGESGGALVIDNGGNPGALSPLAVPSGTRLVLAAGTTMYPVGSLDVVDLHLKPGATLTHTNGQPALSIHVANAFTLEAGATLTASGKGYPVGTDNGPGLGSITSSTGAGGGHGGDGGVAWPGNVSGGVGYGSVLGPVDFGSSGAPGGNPGNARSPGGGAIRVVVDGTFTLDGTLAADGTTAWYDNQGGAAGGSIWITAANLVGAGTISANGGNGEWVDGGGGAGGRIALHLGTSSFAGSLAARGGGGHQAGGAGTIYTRLTQPAIRQVVIENGDRWGAYTPLFTPEPFDLVVSNKAQAYPGGTVVLGSLTTTVNTVLTHLKGQEAFSAVVLGDALLGGVIDVKGRGYPVGVDSGPGAGASKDGMGSGAGHGGKGGGSRTGQPGGLDYGSALEPVAWGSQGGSGSGGAGGHGGGAVRLIVGGTVTLDGSIVANGLNGPADNTGGGSGGSILISARSFMGSGSLSAIGGNGEWVDGGGGAGGRIAIYRTADSFAGTFALEGGGGSARGENGTLQQGSLSGIVWLAPPAGWLNGEVSLDVAFFAASDEPATVDFLAWKGGVAVPIAQVTGARLTARAPWDTRLMADGIVELEALVSDARGARIASARRIVTIQNAVLWHGGLLKTNETWTAERVHAVHRDLTIPSGITLTLEPGAVLKFLPGVRLILQSGGGLVSAGTEALPVTLTSFLDDSAGGDSNLDGAITRPQPGSWKLAWNPGATLDTGDATRIRYHSQSYGGPMAADDTWSAESLREISETVVVPSGITLRIEAGAIIKFAPGRGINVDRGGTLVVTGTAAQPVVFTSRSDDAFAGDTNDDGSRTAPTAGDWRSLRIADGASATLDHALIRFGGNSIGNPWGAGGVLEALGGPLTVRNSVISDALKDGAFCYGTTRFENCLVLRCDRGLTAVGTMEIVNCTIDACRIGLLEHVGQLNVRNTIVSRSIDVGIEHDLGGGVALVTHCNVWNPGATRGNYNGLADRTGRDGNISLAPRYKDADSDNFRLNFASPGIDAASGTDAPATDLAGTPRNDDPRTGNSGTPAANGACPDMGAFEFAESAPSNLDLAVASVSGPADLVAGQLGHVEWTILNRGAEAFTGPWHDALYLQHASSGHRIFVAEPLVGRNTTLGPGQVLTSGADVRIPGGVTGDYRWVIDANSRDDVFEGVNAENNEGTSTGTSSMTVPAIPLDGAPVSGSFAAQEEQQWFQVIAPAGKDVRVALDLAAAAGVTEIYVGRGFMPTDENYSARQREFGAPDTTAIGPGSGDPTGPDERNTYYILAVGRVLDSTPAGFQITASTAPFSIEAVANGPVGNAGEVTLDVRGSGFATNTVFAIRGGGQERVAVRQSVRESGRAFATFDLAGVPAGTADLAASLDGTAVTKAGAVTVVDGGTGDFHASLSGPATTRAGRFTPWFITYGNRGQVDVRLPLLRLRAPGATEFQVFDNTLNWADSITILALNPDVLLPTLGPGQEVTFEVRIKAMSPLTVYLDVLSGGEFAADATAFAWNSLVAPAGADAAHWNVMIATLPGRLGGTVAGYRALLERELAELAASPLRFSYLANVNGRWLFGDEPDDEGLPTPIIEIPPAEEEEPAGMPGLQGEPQKKPGDGIRKTWWVVITIQDYSDRNGHSGNDIAGTAIDYADLQDYMTKDLRVPPAQRVAGHDSPATVSSWSRSNILATLGTFKGQVDADDNLVIVYSGHGGRGGGGTGYLVPNGPGAISPHAFTQIIDAVGAGTTYFVNDSCHAEAFNEGVQPKNTTFVGFGATAKDRISWSSRVHGSWMTTLLKGQLRKCNSLGKSMDRATELVTYRYRNKPTDEQKQKPVLTNPTGASLEGKPWNDPSGFEEILRQGLNNLRFHPWGQAFLNIVGSVDPNEKYALAGVGPEHWVQPGQLLPFEVLFENKTNAAAPAQEVLVTDDLDPRLDWSTFALTSVSFNDTKLAIPEGRQRFTATSAVGTDPYPVDVEIHLNPVSGRITCLIRSLDPATGDLPEDPFAGFLPPNDATHRGEGGFTYTIRPRAGLGDGTILTNRANIIFDPTYGANPPILTPVATNTIDGLAPSSAIEPLPAQGIGEIPLVWAGQDAPNGSGIGSYDIYLSRDQGPYLPWQLATADTTARFLGEPGSTYRFYSVARDLAGNTEAAPAEPDATIAIGGGGAGPVAIAFDGSRIRITYDRGVLQSAPAITGPWTDLPNAVSPVVLAPSGGGRFFRTRQ